MKVLFIVLWILVLIFAFALRDNTFAAAALLAITFVSFQK